jgi:hypothetical protein
MRPALRNCMGQGQVNANIGLRVSTREPLLQSNSNPYSYSFLEPNFTPFVCSLSYISCLSEQSQIRVTAALLLVLTMLSYD